MTLGVEDEARLGRRKGHEPSSLPIEESIQMIMPRIHADVRNGAHFVLGKLGGGKAAALCLEAHELLILLRRHEIAGDVSMTGHFDGFPLGEQTVAAEITGEFGCPNSLGLRHAPSS
jgi:hypothetical protein